MPPFNQQTMETIDLRNWNFPRIVMLEQGKVGVWCQPEEGVSWKCHTVLTNVSPLAAGSDRSLKRGTRL